MRESVCFSGGELTQKSQKQKKELGRELFDALRKGNEPNFDGWKIGDIAYREGLPVQIVELQQHGKNKNQEKTSKIISKNTILSFFVSTFCNM